MTTATGRNVQKCQNHLVTPEIPETAVSALSGIQYHVNQSLGEALIPCFMSVISSTVNYSMYLEMYDLLDPVISVYLVNKIYFSSVPSRNRCMQKFEL